MLTFEIFLNLSGNMKSVDYNRLVETHVYPCFSSFLPNKTQTCRVVGAGDATESSRFP